MSCNKDGIYLLFTSPSYMLVTQYSALVEFKTWSWPSWIRPGKDMPALWLRELTGLQTQWKETLHGGGLV